MRGTLSRIALLVPAGVCLAIAVAMAVQVWNPLREDAYWPLLEDAPGLGDARARVEVYVEDQSLLQLAQEGELRHGPGHIPVDPADLKIRFNDYESVTRAQLMLLAAALGAGLALLVVGLTLPRRPRPVFDLADPETSP